MKTIERSSDLCVLSLLLSATLFLFLLMMTTLLGNLVIQWKLVVQKLFLILPGVSVVVVVLRRSFVGFSMGFEVFHLSTGTRSTSFFFFSPVLTHSDHLPSWTTFLSVFLFLFFFWGGSFTLFSFRLSWWMLFL